MIVETQDNPDSIPLLKCPFRSSSAPGVFNVHFLRSTRSAHGEPGLAIAAAARAPSDRFGGHRGIDRRKAGAGIFYVGEELRLVSGWLQSAGACVARLAKRAIAVTVPHARRRSTACD